MTSAEAPPDPQRLLRIYVQDHLAASAAGTRRIRRLADAERDGPEWAVLDRLATEIAADRDSLNRVAEMLGFHPPRVKKVLARVGEVAALVKLNGRLLRRSPLTSLVETETFVMAIRGKLAGWETLRRALGTARVGSVDLDEQIARSREHYDMIVAVHERVGASVLAEASA